MVSRGTDNGWPEGAKASLLVSTALRDKHQGRSFHLGDRYRLQIEVATNWTLSRPKHLVRASNLGGIWDLGGGLDRGQGINGGGPLAGRERREKLSAMYYVYIRCKVLFSAQSDNE